MTTVKAQSQLRNRRVLYGRRSGRALSPRRNLLFETLLPKVTLSLNQLAQRAFFDEPIEDLWLEVGFGAGEHLAAQAAVHPKVGFIGCEPFIEGIARLLEHIDAQGLRNIRIHPDDARNVLERLPEDSLGRVFLLFPDPWPKMRHWKRRFINAENLAMLERAMRSGAELRIASDQPDYILWTKEQITANQSFSLVAESATRPPAWPHTRYEQKALKSGRSCKYLIVQRS